MSPMRSAGNSDPYAGRIKLSTTVARPVSDFLESRARGSKKPLGRVIDEIVSDFQHRRIEDELARGYELMNQENLEFAELALSAQAEVLEKRAATQKRRTVLGRFQRRARK